jgi:hypothetical protein
MGQQQVCVQEHVYVCLCMSAFFFSLLETSNSIGIHWSITSPTGGLFGSISTILSQNSILVKFGAKWSDFGILPLFHYDTLTHFRKPVFQYDHIRKTRKP